MFQGRLWATLAEVGSRTVAKSVIQRLGNSYEGGNTNTTGGLTVAEQSIFSPAGGDRDGVQNIIVLLTDGMDLSQWLFWDQLIPNRHKPARQYTTCQRLELTMVCNAIPAHESVRVNSQPGAVRDVLFGFNIYTLLVQKDNVHGDGYLHRDCYNLEQP